MKLEAIQQRLKIIKQINFKLIEEKEYYPHQKSKNFRKKKGIFYTPKEITFYICFQSITSYIFQFTNQKALEINSDLLLQLLNQLNRIKILDPACGAGVFLIQAAEILLEFQKFILKQLNKPINESKIREGILQKNIFGLDLFEDAVSTTKIRLLEWMRSADGTNPSSSLINKVNSNILVGNSLFGWLNEDLCNINLNSPKIINQKFLKTIVNELPDKYKKDFSDIQDLKPFHWKIEFAQIIDEGGFDIIVGNPPYVFIRGQNFSPIEKIFYKTKYLNNYESLAKGKARQSRKINTFSLFIIRSLDLLKPKGFLGFIVPNTILRTTTNDFIRQFILKETHIQEILDLKEGIFKGITASTILLFLQKTKNSIAPTMINYNIRDLLNFEFDSHYITQLRFLENPVYAYNIHLTSEMEEAFNSMKKNTFELGSITKEIIEGIVCRKSDNLFSDDPTHPLAKKLLRGKDIGRYQINWPVGQYILYATDTTLTKTKLHRPRPQWVHDSLEKFLTQRIGGGLYPIKVALDKSQYYTFASINNIIFNNPPIHDEKEYLPKYVLAILNSKLMNAFYLLNYSNLSSLTVNISKTFLESLPIKQVELPTQGLILRLVDYVLFLYQYPEKAGALISFFDNWILDSLIYEIYMQDQLPTNISEILVDYIPELPPAWSEEKKFQFFFQLLLRIQQEPRINQELTNIKSNPIIKKIEHLFQNRDRLIQRKG